MSQFVFGAGVLWGTPTTDAAGNAINNPTPVQFGTLQEVSLDVSFENKTLHGQNQFPVAVGRGKGKVSGKAKFAQMNGTLINSLFFGQNMNSGIIADVYDTNGATVPSGLTITVTPPNSGTFVADLGVRDVNGLPMTRVASSPITGQYAVDTDTGEYTFATLDEDALVFINYQYQSNITTARKSTVNNVLMGYAPSFRVDVSMPYQGKTLIMSLPNAISTKLSFATKLDDFMMPEFDFEGFASSNGDVLTYSLTDR